jgi:hypothetical protein
LYPAAKAAAAPLIQPHVARYFDTLLSIKKQRVASIASSDCVFAQDLTIGLGPVLVSSCMDIAQSDEQDALSCVEGAVAGNRLEYSSESQLSDLSQRCSCSSDSVERGQAIAAACVVASICGSWDRVFGFVLEGSADLEQPYRGRTALMVAAEHSDAMHVLDLLIRRGASCNFVG